MLLRIIFQNKQVNVLTSHVFHNLFHAITAPGSMIVSFLAPLANMEAMSLATGCGVKNCPISAL
jgi:hypothetical protein